ncbi:hypothetical protein [Pseudomonas sp. Snoq117.2]|uniref:hypothetical protein n=1 Tax=Pseudomonas sp. Snoq117.2 TaxID=1500302 RepID=UPI0008CF20BB|nr:hypothetical protein [Pseudomonas sp. Snoq117.2]SEO63559.1 hypothetical protein SAMN02787149_101780 [Pseudomonas sp. Snoq117.2]
MTKPVWGCPYHGLVEDGKLTLSNGKTLKHPHTYRDSYSFTGSTFLVKHPLAAAVERSDEEREEDSKRGWQWWDRAIIGGGQLHGGQLNGWIYIDPDGACWRVTFDFLSVDWSITLARFGVLSGEPETYNYPIVKPNLGQGAPAVTQPPGASKDPVALLHHATVTGDRAAIELTLYFGDDQAWRFRPVGWLELSLSGKGAQCEAALTVLYTRAQTLGTAFEMPLAEEIEYWWADYTETGSYSLGHGPNPPKSWFLYATVASGSASQGFNGWLVGIHYDEKGDRHLTRLSAQTTTTYQLPPLEHEGADSFGPNEPLVGKWTQKRRMTGVHVLTITYDGNPIASWALQYSEQIEESAELLQELTQDGKYRSSAAGTVAFSTGDTRAVNRTVDVPYSSSNGLVVIGGRYATVPLAANQPGEIPYSIDKGYAQWWKNGDAASLRLIPQRLSNQVFGVAQALVDQTDWDAQVATPDGAQALPALVVPLGYEQGGNRIYATWCPVTHAVARSQRPVCYI